MGEMSRFVPVKARKPNQCKQYGKRIEPREIYFRNLAMSKSHLYCERCKEAEIRKQGGIQTDKANKPGPIRNRKGFQPDRPDRPREEDLSVFEIIGVAGMIMGIVIFIMGGTLSISGDKSLGGGYFGVGLIILCLAGCGRFFSSKKDPWAVVIFANRFTVGCRNHATQVNAAWCLE